LPIAQLLLLATGLLGIILFHMDTYFPISVSMAIFVGVSWLLIQRFRTKQIGLLILLLWLVFALPFIEMPSYLWADFNSPASLLKWGLGPIDYAMNEEIVALTAMLGAIGGVGIAFGVFSGQSTSVRVEKRLDGIERPRKFLTMDIPFYLVWVIVGVGISVIFSPQETIFEARYTTGTGLVSVNLGSGWMISYAILTFAFCDALLDNVKARMLIKKKVIFLAVAYIVIVLQLLRGDRDSLPWVVGLAGIFFYWGKNYTQEARSKIRWSKVAILVLLILSSNMIIGAIRSAALDVRDLDSFLSLLSTQSDDGRIGFSNLVHGTWSAAIMGPLSVAGDSVNGILDMKWGKTYADLVLSIPPGALADALGYERPIDGTKGPAWEMRYGMGGTHAVVVPFMNFRMAGVFVIPAIWAYVMVLYERSAMRQVTVKGLSFFGIMVMAAPHWLWYGEKSGFNAVLIWAILAFFYRLSIPHTAAVQQYAR